MTLSECAESLRSAIRHRERMNANLYVVVKGGEKVKIENPRDIFLDAMKIALAVVEEKLQ